MLLPRAMAKFEVHIPAASAGGFHMTLKVSADNWMAALKAGMQKVGEQGASMQNLMVDVQEDNSIHVTDATSGRVFRIRELSDEEAAKAPVKKNPSGIYTMPAELAPKADAGAAAAPTKVEPSSAKTEPPGKAPPAKPSTPAAKTTPAKPSASENKTLIQEAPPPADGSTGEEATHVPDRKRTEPAKSEPAAAPTDATVPFTGSQPTPLPFKKPYRSGKSSPRMEVGDIEELEAPVAPVTGQIGRPKTSPAQQAVVKQNVEDLLADIFLRVNELEGKSDIEAAMLFVLDLAMEKVPCEAGSVLRADAGSGDLTFLCARGPKSKEVMAAKMVIPAGSGIAGFCAIEGVSLALSDVQKDPRFYAAVGQKVDFATKSLLCAPMMTHGRSFGCMQLLNRNGGAQFQEHEVGVLSYLSHQAALFLNRNV